MSLADWSIDIVEELDGMLDILDLLLGLDCETDTEAAAAACLTNDSKQIFTSRPRLQTVNKIQANEFPIDFQRDFIKFPLFRQLFTRQANVHKLRNGEYF